MIRTLLRTALPLALLLVSGCIDEPSGPTKADALLLASGVPVTDLSGILNSRKYFRIVVPTGASSIIATTTGGTGDVDLLLNYRDIPPVNGADCGSVNTGNEDSCGFPTPPPGDWYILLYGSQSYSGVTLTVTVSMTQ